MARAARERDSKFKRKPCFSQTNLWFIMHVFFPFLTTVFDKSYLNYWDKFIEL